MYDQWSDINSDYPSKSQKGGSQRQKGMTSVNFRQGRMV